MELSKWYITLETPETSESNFDNIKKTIESIIQDEDMEFTNNPHITLDFMWIIKLESAIKKLKDIQPSINQDMINSIKSIKIWAFESFMSNKNWKRIFYLNIEWWDIFFEHIRKIWYSLQIPHLTIFETNSVSSEDQVNDILQKLNTSPELNNYIRRLFLDKDNIYLRNKTEWKESEIIEVLKLGFPDSSLI